MIEWKLKFKLRTSDKQMQCMVSLLSSMTNDRTLLFSKNKFFIFNKTDDDYKYVIDWEQIQSTDILKFTNYKIELFWLYEQLFNKKEMFVSAPILKEWEDITKEFKDLFLQLVKLWYIDDMSYQAYLLLLYSWKVLFNWKHIWFNFIEDKWKKLFWKWIVSKFSKFDSFELEDVLDAEVLQWFVNEEIWDPNRWYWYTHLLRKHAKFFTTKWFRNVLINWKKINVIYASRSNWKTYDSAFIVWRALLNKKPWFWWRPYREIKYFVPNKDWIWENFFRYVKAILWQLIDVKVNWKKLFKINEADFSIECTLTWNRLEVVSLHKLIQNSSNELWVSTWEWIACDDCIIDEAARIPDKFWTSFYQRAAFETESFFIITTANEETPVNHWSYELLLRWELWDDNIASYRITIDDNEILRLWVTNEQWDKIIENIKEETKIKSWEEAYYARLYCVLFNKKKLFNITWNLKLRDNESNDNDFRVISLDPAKLSDNAWIVVINVKRRIIEEAEKLIWADYEYQLELIKLKKEKYKNSICVCDRTWVWEYIAELDKKHNVIDVRIKSKWQWDLNILNWYYTISKTFLIWFLDTVFNKKVLRLFEDLSDLIYQLWKFVEVKSKHSNIVLYKWEWKEKDDLVLSLAWAVCYIYKILWLHTAEDWENYANQFDNSTIYSYNDNNNNDNDYYNPVY